MRPVGQGAAAFARGCRIRSRSYARGCITGARIPGVAAAAGYQAQAGDRAALEQVLRIVRPIVPRGCRARLGSGHGHLDPEDTAQDVLCAITAGNERHDPVRPFLARVTAITGHKATDAFRRHHRDPSSPVDEVPEHTDPGDTPEPALLRAEPADELRVLLARFAEVQQSILVLRLVGRASAAETAELLGMTPGKRPRGTAPRPSPAARARRRGNRCPRTITPTAVGSPPMTASSPPTGTCS